MTADRETDERVKEGVEHLQSAALELIAAARIFLDLAEDAVRDPAPFVARANAAARRHPGNGRAAADEVQRIRVV